MTRPAPDGASAEDGSAERAACKDAAGTHAPVIDRARCEGKEDCVRVCPYDVFEVRRIDDADYAALSFFGKLKSVAHGRKSAYAARAADCHACGLCVTACPEKAIKLRARGGADRSQSGGG
jgi:NAD-dependent dihydropyrimidine dehydrogenase PreA subunit